MTCTGDDHPAASATPPELSDLPDLPHLSRRRRHRLSPHRPTQPLRRPQSFEAQARRALWLTPAAEADKVALIRRATFDLHGLPPVLPSTDDPERAESVVQRAAFLEFQITDKTQALEKVLPRLDGLVRERRLASTRTTPGAAPAVDVLGAQDAAADGGTAGDGAPPVPPATGASRDGVLTRRRSKKSQLVWSSPCTLLESSKRGAPEASAYWFSATRAS